MQDPITLKSGAELQIQLGSFASGTRLLQTVARTLASVEIDFDMSDLKDIGAKDINSLKNVFLALLASEAVERDALECAKKCLYNKERIVTGTFEPETARADYIPVMVEVMKANLRPFFSGLDLSSLTGLKPQLPAQK